MLRFSDIRIQCLFTEMAPRILCEVVPLSEIAFTIHDVMALRKYLMADNFIATLPPLSPTRDRKRSERKMDLPIGSMPLIPLKSIFLCQGNVGKDFCSSAFG